MRVPDDLTAGGGFGPVTADGYGVSYIIVGENKIFFHVSCRKHSQITNAERFAGNIRQAMRDMIEIFNVTID